MKSCTEFRLLFLLGIIQPCVHCFDTGTLHNLLAPENSNLPKFVCEIVKNVAYTDRSVKTIAMAIFNNNFDKAKIDEILKCLPKRLTLIIQDFQSEKLITSLNKKTSIVIMIADEINTVSY